MRIEHSFFLCFLLMSACTKNITVDTPDLQVSASKTTYKVGELVTFKITGNVEHITFYSGETDKKYEYRNRVSEKGTPDLQFTSYLQNPGEINTLQLLASTDFKGEYTPESIKLANWVDITSRATLSTGTDNKESGKIDLSDFSNEENKPLYLAFKYRGYTDPVLKQPTWTIRTFNVSNVLSDGKRALITAINNVGWYANSYQNDFVKWGIASTGQASIAGTAAGTDNSANEDWIVTRPLYLKTAIPDIGTAIQYLSSAVVTEKTYTYLAPGKYTVTFLGINNSLDEQKEVVKEVSITVEP